MASDEDSAKEKLLGVPEVAKELSYSEKAIREILNRGELKGTRLRPGGKWLVTRGDLDDFKEKHGIGQKTNKVEAEHTMKLDEQSINAQVSWEMRKISHDEGIFREADSVLSERDVRRIVLVLRGANAINYSDLTMLESFFNFVYLPATHQYTIKELNDDYSKFITSLDNLLKFTGRHFYPSDTENKTELWVPTDKRYNFEWDIETWQRYHNLEKALNKLIDRMHEAYKVYRTSITKILVPLEQVTKTTQVALQHDIAIFKKFENMLSEQQLLSILSRIEHGYHIWDVSWVDLLCEFGSSSGYESNKYIDSHIQECCDSFRSMVDEFTVFLSKESHNFPDLDDTRLLLRPDLRSPHLPQYKIPKNQRSESKKEYKLLEERLFYLINSVRTTYSTYKATVRQSLFV
jgi:hypothetical protein